MAEQHLTARQPAHVLCFPTRPTRARRRSMHAATETAMHFSIEQRWRDVANLEIVRELEALLAHAHAGHIIGFVWAGCQFDSAVNGWRQFAADTPGPQLAIRPSAANWRQRC